MDPTAASRLRQKLCSLREERQRLEHDLLEVRALLRGPLIAHYTLSGGQRRRHPAFYLYRRQDGRKRLLYVRKGHLEKVRRLVETYKRYREGLRRLRALGEEILTSYCALRDSLEDSLPS
jgi:hypothetical protein